MFTTPKKTRKTQGTSIFHGFSVVFPWFCPFQKNSDLGDDPKRLGVAHRGQAPEEGSWGVAKTAAPGDAMVYSNG
jgi:hypothetical protein